MEKQPTAFMREVREERARRTRYRKHTRAFSCPSDCLLVLLTLLLLSTCCVYIFSSSPSVSARHARSRSLYSLAIFLAPYLVERSYFLHARIRLEVLKFEFTYNESRALLSLFAHLSLPAFTSLLLLLLLLLRFACVCSLFNGLPALLLEVIGSTLLGFSVVIGFCVGRSKQCRERCALRTLERCCSRRRRRRRRRRWHLVSAMLIGQRCRARCVSSKWVHEMVCRMKPRSCLRQTVSRW